jgi:hypothetical protein
MDPATLRDKIAKGQYQVDPTAVADAFLRRALAQNECSYPASSPSASANTTPGGPSITDPTQVMFLRALGLRPGRHTHNS